LCGPTSYNALIKVIIKIFERRIHHCDSIMINVQMFIITHIALCARLVLQKSSQAKGGVPLQRVKIIK